MLNDVVQCQCLVAEGQSQYGDARSDPRLGRYSLEEMSALG
jgi:hypothetical protein